MENIRDKILNNTDIVSLVSEYVTLKPAGANYSACCPFHNEKTPSFMVSPIKQIFHCFGCGAGGNAINFIERINGLSYYETVRFLAEKYGIELPKNDRYNNKDNADLIDINIAAQQFFKQEIKRHKFAEDYARKRGLNDETIALFGIGYAPDKWSELRNYLNSQGYKDDKIMEAGLIIKRDDGGYYDRFRNRLIFPIFNISGKPVAFGGRVFDAEADYKYINSPETSLYHKGSMLYGLHLSKKYIMQENRVLILEGYLDLITCFQFGIKNVVATLGTALTPMQIRLLTRFTKNMVMVYDGDSAGISAMARSIERLLELDIYPDVYIIEDDMDPAEIVLLKGSDYFLNKLASPQSFFDFSIKRLMNIHNIKSIKGKKNVIEEMVKILQHINDNIVLSEYIKKMSEILQVDYSVLYSEIQKMIRITRSKTLDRTEKNVIDTDQTTNELLEQTNQLELKILKLMIESNDNVLIEKFKKIIILDKIQPPLIDIYKYIFENDNAEIQNMLDYFNQAEELKRIITSLSIEKIAYQEDEFDTLINDCINLYSSRRIADDTKQFVTILKQNEHLINDKLDDVTNLIQQQLEEKRSRLNLLKTSNLKN